MESVSSLFHVFLNHFLSSPAPTGVPNYQPMLAILQQVVEALRSESQCDMVIQKAVSDFYLNTQNHAALQSINGRQFSTALLLQFTQGGRCPIAIPMKELFSSHDHNRSLYGNIWLTWYKLGQVAVPETTQTYSEQMRHIQAMIPSQLVPSNGNPPPMDDMFNIKGLMEIGPQVLALVSKVIPALSSFDSTNALGKVEEALANLLSQTDVPNAQQGTALIMQGLRLLSQPSTPQGTQMQ
jgi:hypothetical protein